MAEERGNGEREGEVVVDDEMDEGEIPENESHEGSSAEKSGEPIAMPPHSLEHSWTFWFDDPSGKAKQGAWGSSIRPIYTFHTVENFWRLYNNIYQPSMLISGADIYCFKYKIEPKWEDPICANGGRWTIVCQRGKSDTLWLHTLLAMIGEQFDYGDEICGAVVNARPKQERIALWTKNSSNEAVQLSIGRQWKELLDCNDQIGFISHDDAKRLERAAKNKYTV